MTELISLVRVDINNFIFGKQAYCALEKKGRCLELMRLVIRLFCHFQDGLSLKETSRLGYNNCESFVKGPSEETTIDVICPKTVLAPSWPFYLKTVETGKASANRMLPANEKKLGKT